MQPNEIQQTQNDMQATMLNENEKEEVTVDEKVVTQNKPKASTILSILFTLVLLLALVGVGYWAYTLNVTLTETRQQLSELQAKYATLEGEYATLQSDNDKLTTDLAQSNEDLEKVNADLKKWQIKNRDSLAQIEDAKKYIEVLYAWVHVSEPSDLLTIDSLTKATGNQPLIDRWNEMIKSPGDDLFESYLGYLISAIRSSLR